MSVRQLCVELVNSANPKAVRRVTLNATLGTPELLGYAFNAVFLLIERRVLAWHRGARAASE